MSTRFTLRDLAGSPPRIEKRGDPDALDREAAALGRLAGVPWAPAVVAHEPGRLVTTRLPGAPRTAGALAPADARRLGAVLAALHGGSRAPAGGVWWWAAPARSLEEYRAGRVADAEAAVAGTPHAGLAAGAPAPPARDEGPEPFRMAHGDLVLANVVWGPEGPGLVDWEFWRMADPAEDLAYLVVVNALPAVAAAAVLDGYGDPGMAARVAAWGPVVAADAAGWYLREGMGEEAARVLAAVSPAPPRPAGRGR